MTDADPRRVSARLTMTRLFKIYMRPQLPLIMAGVFCNLFVAGFTSLYPLFIQEAIDNISLEELSWPFWVFPLGIVSLMGLRGSFIFLGGVSLGYAGQRMVIAIRKDLFVHIVHADYQWITGTHSGRFLAAFMSDTGAIDNAMQAAGVDMMRNLFIILGLLAYIAYVNLWFTLALFAILPLAAAITGLFGLLTRKSQTVLMQENAHFSMRVSETLKNLRTIKVYDGETTEVARMRQVLANMERHFGRAKKASLAPSAIIELLTGIGISLVLIAVWLVEWEIGGFGEAGTFAGLLAALLLAYGSLRRLASSYTTMENGLASAIRVFNLMDKKPEIRDRPDAKPIPKHKTAIAFHNVHFRYSDHTEALRGVSFTIPQGQSAALVGMSGGGKSTILNLIPRFYDPREGRITIGGEDIRGIKMESLRASLALVTQEPIIFDDSVRDNIAYARRGASEEEIAAAAKNAAADGFIRALPKGYDTKVGEGGIRLSGGERQRVALARAMLKNAPILLMDEPTSSLDQESERHIQKALANLMTGRTTLIIAHRLSTIMHVDRIHVVHQGRIVEKGSHQELIGAGGAYAQLYGHVHS